MKVKEISVAIDRKVNLGNYESLGVHVGMTVDIPDDASSYSEYLDEAWLDLKEIIEEKILDYVETVPKKK